MLITDIAFNGINEYFTWIIGVFAVFELVAIFFRNSYFKSVILSIGIFGTFLGIFLGLQDFNIKDIDNSLNSLLDGMTTAFYSSLLGMFSVIILTTLEKLIEIFMRENKEENSLENVSKQSDRDISENILKELIFQTKEFKRLEQIEKKLEALNSLNSIDKKLSPISNLEKLNILDDLKTLKLSKTNLLSIPILEFASPKSIKQSTRFPLLNVS